MTTFAKSVSVGNGLHSTTSAPKSVVPIDQPTADMIQPISGFVEDLALDEPGKRVLTDIRYICECFGFPMFIRHSRYMERDEPKSAGVLKNARLECSKGCGFSIHIDTGQLVDDGSNRYK